MFDEVKVSVGIPTYNRPDGVLRTIKQITSQTHENIEIIISNNASLNEYVKPLLDRCAEMDARIKVVHQDSNIGIVKNFKYVLQKSSSKYFMWAADDDEWDISFIKTCVNALEETNVGTVMPGFYRHNRALDVKGMADLPKMNGVDRFSDAMKFYEAMPHSMMYGVHKRETMLWFLDEDDSMCDDEYLLIRQILHNGIVTLPEKILYCAGIEDAQYKVKLPKEADDRYFFQYKRLLNFAKLVAESEALNDVQKMMLLQKIVLAKLRFIIGFEKGMRNDEQYQLVCNLYNFVSAIDFRYITSYVKILGGVSSLLAEINSR